MFGHERFEAYQLSIQFLRIALELAEKIPTGYCAVKDQLNRAALSVPLNIAEGSGKRQIADRNRFYGIASGSAMECAALCDVIGIIMPATIDLLTQGKSLLKSVVSILVAVSDKGKGEDKNKV